MNILIATISIFQSKVQKIGYSIEVGSDTYCFDAFQTNESILKGVVKVLGNQNIEKVIALCSNAVLEKRASNCAEFPEIANRTALEYYREVARKDFPDVEFVEVNIETINNQERPTGEVMQEICDNISEGDNVYIDIAGGQRTTANIIQLLTKLLRYKGINNPGSYYSNIQRNEQGKIEGGTIENTSDFVRLMDLADAVNEFVTTGKSDQLQVIYDLFEDDDLKALISVMKEFSDKVRLVDIGKLDQIVSNLKAAISDIYESRNTDIEYVVLRQLLDVIKDKLLGNTDNIDYSKIIMWCVDNGLIQQALAIFVEKVPVLLDSLGLVRYLGDMPSEYNPKLVTSPQVFAFYKYLITFTQLRIVHFNNDIVRKYIEDILSKARSKKELSDNTITFAKDMLNVELTRPQIESFFDRYKQLKGITQYQSFLNSLMNNFDAIKKLLGTEEIVHFDFDTVVLAESGEYSNPKFDIRITNMQLSKIMLGYLYVKKIRNQVSHVLSDDLLSEDEQYFLSTRGYNFSEYSVSTVSSNIKLALSSVTDVMGE